METRQRWHRRCGARTRRGRSQVVATAPTVFICLAVLLLALGGCGIGGVVTLPVVTPIVFTPTPTPTIPAIPQPQLVAPADAELYLANATTGQVYLAVNAEKPMAMASTTKIMTALVALSYGKLDQPIKIGADATAQNNGVNSVANLRQGDTLGLGDLLYALLLPSGDDAAVAIADGVAGSQEHFVALMNLEATVLGLSKTTHYVNVHGLDADGHYTTARDLATLTASAMTFKAFHDAVGTTKYTLGATAAHGRYTWTTTNELLPGEINQYNGAIGVKTGHTGNAGYCLVFSASRPEGRLVGVILGEPTAEGRFTDAKLLLTWGFQIEQKQAG